MVPNRCASRLLQAPDDCEISPPSFPRPTFPGCQRRCCRGAYSARVWKSFSFGFPPFLNFRIAPNVKGRLNMFRLPGRSVPSPMAAQSARTVSPLYPNVVFVCLLRSFTAASPRSRRRKLCLHRFRASTKAHPARCSSSPQKVSRLFGDPCYREVISRSDGYSIVKDHLSKSPYDGLFVLCFVLPKKCPLTIRTKNGQKVRFFKKIIANNLTLFICPSLIYGFQAVSTPFFQSPLNFALTYIQFS